MPKTATD